MTLEKILQSQGWGSRKECRFLITRGRVLVHGVRAEDPTKDFDTKGLIYTLGEVEYKFRDKIILALNKPPGYECTRSSTHHSSVFELLPPHLVNREIQCIGRLDQDTTGLLLLTDDGPLLHRLTSPRHHVKKTYRVTTGNEVTPLLIQRLIEGVMLRGEEQLTKALECFQTGTFTLDLVIDEGKYHQVKRMLAAAGNSCEALERLSTGQLTLESLGLGQGQWCELTPAQSDLLEKDSL